MKHLNRWTCASLAAGLAFTAGAEGAGDWLERMGLEAMPDAAAIGAPVHPRGGTPIAATLVTQAGAMPPGGGGAPVTVLNSPFTNGLGEVGFTGAVNPGSGNDHFVWVDDGIAWRNSDAVGITLSGGEGTMGISDAGGFIYSPSANGNDAVWTHNGLLAAGGQAAPGFPEGTVLTFNSRPTMSANGAAHWIAGVNFSGGTSSQGRVLYTAGDATPATMTAILRSGDLVNGFPITASGVDFDYWVSDDASHRIIVLQLTTGSTANDNVVWVDGTVVAQESGPTGSGDNWSNFDSVSINDAGDYLFSGDTDGATATDEFIAYNGTIALREGDVVDGVALASSASVQALSLNNLGQAVHLWSVSGGVEHLFAACDASDLAGSLRLLSTGDALDFDGDGIADATVADFNASGTIGPGLDLAEDGRVFVEVDIDAGSGAQEAVIAIAFPVCNDVIFADGFEAPPT